MADDPQRLLRLAASLCDGDAVDWDRALDLASTAAEQQVIRRLGVIAGIAGAHRTLSLREPAVGQIGPSSNPVAGSAEPGLLDGYQIIEKIGEGPMGAVYRAALAAQPDRELALKIIKWELDIRQVCERFAEVRLQLERMSHPGIARIHALNVSPSGRLYFTMELVRGVPWTDYCASCRLGIRDRLRLFLEVCEAVRCGHEAGLVHLRLKPSNLLVSQVAAGAAEPPIRILDFGIAVATSQWAVERGLRARLRRPVATSPYLSPEELAGPGEPADTRADVFSLGVLLADLLAGQALGTAEALIARATDAEPDQRHASAAELADDVRVLLDG